MENINIPIRYSKINRLFRISAAIFVSLVLLLYGEPFNALKVLLMPVFYLALLCSFAIAFTLISLVRIATVQLDKRVSWDDNLLLRLLLQTGFGLLIPSIAAYLLAALYFYIRGRDIEQTDYTLMEFPIIVFMLLLLNICYFVHYKYSTLKMAYQWLSKENQRLSSFIAHQDYNIKIADAGEILTVTYKNRPFDLSARKDVVIIYSNQGNWVISREGRRFNTGLTLKAIAEQYHDYDLIQINKQCIVHRSVIENIVPRRGTNTYTIHLKDEFAGFDKVKEREALLFISKKFWEGFQEGRQ